METFKDQLVLAHPNRGAHAEAAQKFRSLSHEFVRWGKMANVEVIPYEDSSLPYFSALSLQQKLDILKQMQFQNDICSSAEAAGSNLADSLRLVWGAIRNLNLRPPSNLFDRITSDCVLEINSGVYQAFRSFSYFEYCSYTLEDLYCRAWTDLWHREPMLTEQILGLVDQTRQTRETVWAPPNNHLVTETNSAKKFALDYNLKFMAPLFDQNTGAVTHVLIGIKAAFRATRLESRSRSL